MSDTSFKLSVPFSLMRSANKLQGMGCTNEHNRDWRALETDHYKDANGDKTGREERPLSGQKTTDYETMFGTTRALV